MIAAIELPEATPELLARWVAFLKQDAVAHGGSASTMLRLRGGGVVRIQACASVVIVEEVSDPTEAAIEHASWLVSLRDSVT